VTDRPGIFTSLVGLVGGVLTIVASLIALGVLAGIVAWLVVEAFGLAWDLMELVAS
jgi:hypothetical protein